MAKKQTGIIMELEVLKNDLGLQECNDRTLACRDCRYNNFGENRNKLGDTCGVVVILNNIREVTYNYNEKYNPEDEAKNRKETVKNIEGLYFEKGE